MAARFAAGLTQEQLAQAAGVSRATINQLEGGEGDPSLSTLVLLSGPLEVSPMLLLMGGRTELMEIAEAEKATAKVPMEEVALLNRLLRSGITKQRKRAVETAANWAGGCIATIVYLLTKAETR